MKKIKLLFYSPLLFLVPFVPYFIPEAEQQPAIVAEPVARVVVDTLQAQVTSPEKATETTKSKTTASSKSFAGVSRHEIVNYALSLLGKPYSYGGTTSRGFDCSGFTSHVFNTFGIDVSRSSSMQAGDGNFIPKDKAKPGDLVIFTGTNPKQRTPGHVGIVISQPGDTISFVHSSSVGGVKISKIQGTRYNTRFLQIRRVL